MLRFLAGRGYHVVRVRGSHHFVEGNDRRTTVPVHGNRPLKIGTLRSILRDLDLNPADFADQWTN